MCAELLPSGATLDEWGYPILDGCHCHLTLSHPHGGGRCVPDACAPPRAGGPMSTPLRPVALCAVAIGSIAGCGSGISITTVAQSRRCPSTTAHPRTVAVGNRGQVVSAPSCPRLLPTATGFTTSGFIPAVTVRGQPAVWITPTRTSPYWRSTSVWSISARFRDGRRRLDWLALRARDRRDRATTTRGRLQRRVKLDVGAGGFESYGRVGSPLSDGLGSIVTYADGLTDIGSWHQGVPAPGRPVVSVRQNLHLLIDAGHPAANLGCLLCWGATLNGVIAPARSALGITAHGHLVWAGGENLTIQDLADALLGAKSCARSSSTSTRSGSRPTSTVIGAVMASWPQCRSSRASQACLENSSTLQPRFLHHHGPLTRIDLSPKQRGRVHYLPSGRERVSTHLPVALFPI